jgi:hypothetical protein
MQSAMRFGGGQVFQNTNASTFFSAEDGVLNEFEMMWNLRIVFPLHFVVFKQNVCHLASETNVEHVFSNPLSKISWTSTMRCSDSDADG